MTPAVYRNPRYEARLVLAEAQIVELANLLAFHGELVRKLSVALARLDIDAQMPALPEIRNRGFGMGH